LGIFLYIIIYTIIIQQRYLRSEAPYGTIRATVKQAASWTPAETLPYCGQNNATYKGFTNYNCTYLLGVDLTYPPADTDSIFVATRIKDTLTKLPEPNCTMTPLTIGCAPNITNAASNRYYTAGIESYTIYMEHAVFGRENSILLDNTQCHGELHFRNNSKQTIKFTDPARGGDIIDLQTILNAADVSSLDILSGVAGGTPLRYDGTLIVAVVNYQNSAQNSDTFTYTYELYHIPGLNVLAMQPSVELPDGTITQRTWYGVKIIFLVVGAIGYFDFPTLLQAVVAGLVLVKVASTIVDLLILYVLPDKVLYSKHIFEVTEDFGDIRSQRKHDEVFDK